VNDSTDDARPVAWITGGGGLIGSNLVRAAAEFAARWRVVGLTRDRLDLAAFAAVEAAFRATKPSLIIHCAAMSRAPECEANPRLARLQNVDVTAQLAKLAAGIPFVFISTDLVFDGRKGGYKEPDAVGPLGVYAETKVAAERVVLANPRHLVVRTSLTGGTSPAGDRGFNEQLRRAWSAGAVPKLFEDEYRSPLAATVTARAIWELVMLGTTGLLHVAGRERLSRLQIGHLVAARWPHLKPRIEAASIASYTGPPRAPDSSLDSAKAQSLLSFPLPGLAEWLACHPDETF